MNNNVNKNNNKMDSNNQFIIKMYKSRQFLFNIINKIAETYNN